MIQQPQLRCHGVSGVGQVVLSAPLGSGHLGGPRGAVGGWAHLPLSCTVLLAFSSLRKGHGLALRGRSEAFEWEPLKVPAAVLVCPFSQGRAPEQGEAKSQPAV